MRSSRPRAPGRHPHCSTTSEPSRARLYAPRTGPVGRERRGTPDGGHRNLGVASSVSPWEFSRPPSRYPIDVRAREERPLAREERRARLSAANALATRNGPVLNTPAPPAELGGV